MDKLVIAVDGPASSGKGTLAARLARRFDLVYFDTGLLYRRVGLDGHRRGLADGDVAGYEALAVEVSETLSWADLAEPALRSPEASHGASVCAAIPGVREALLPLQQNFALHPPAEIEGKPCRGVVMDGRDIGTVVCPAAQPKFFLTASAESRARRRVGFLSERGFDADYAAVLADIQERDARDSGRAFRPLKPAADAIIIDSTDLSIDAVEALAAAHIESVLARGAA